jgi:signal transduction histidine kinase
MKDEAVTYTPTYQSSYPQITFYGAVVGVMLTSAFVLLYYFSGYPLIEVEFNLLALLFCLLAYILVRWMKRPLASAHLVTLGVFTSFFGPALVTGGINSSSMIWLILIPVVAALMGGKWASLIWSLITFFVLSFIYYLNQFLFININLRTPNATDRFIDLAFVILTTTLSVWINENIKQRIFDQLERFRSRLEETNREMEAFVYSVSHDLRAPLRSIDGFARIIQEDYGDSFDGTLKHDFDRIRNAAQRMSQLIEDLLKLSRVSHSEIWITSVDLSSLARETILELSTIEPDRRVEILLPDRLLVKGDLNLLRIVINNLVRNAWKFTAKSANQRIELGSCTENKQMVIFIRDNGAGFDMTRAEKLFAPFQRLHSSAEFEGTGIGLSIVKRIIQRHGGRIWAEGVVDQGATFYFTLS